MTTNENPLKTLQDRALDAIVARKWLVTVGGVALAAVAALGATRIEFKNDYRYFFADENPHLAAFETLQQTYTKNDNILVAIAPRSGEVFDDATLRAIDDLTERAWKLPFASRVDSITNFQHTRADGDELIVEDLFDPARTYTREELDGLRRVALEEPVLKDRLIAEDASVTGVNIQLELPGKSPDEATHSAEAARALASAIQAQHPELELHLTGTAMLSNAFFEASLQDMATLIPAMFLVLVLTLLLFLRSPWATVATVGLITISASAAMGIAGWLGIPITPPTSTAPTMILTLAVADSVHILVLLLQRMRAGDEKIVALKKSLQMNVVPVFLTSLTTAIGLLSLNSSEVPPFRDLGNVATFGVAIAFVYAIVWLPAVVAILPIRAPKPKTSGDRRIVERIGEFVIRRRTPLLAAAAAMVFASIALLPQNELNDQFVEYFDDSFAFRTDTDFTTDNLTGIYTLEYSLESGENDGIADPAYLDRVARFADWFRAQPGVVHVSTILDVLERLNKNMHGDDPAFFRVPENRELAAQYLLLYEMSLPYGLDLNNQINVSKSATRFVVTTDQMTAKESIELSRAGERWLASNTPASMHAHASSTSLMFSHVSGRNVRGILVGMVIAVLLVSLILGLALKSAKYGALSLLPNLVPAAAAFGLWGLIDGRIDLGLSIVATVSLGIVVDDSVHFLSKYLRARREGRDPIEATRYAFSTVGAALVVTSFVLVAGFGILAQSPFGMNAGMGLLTAVTLAVALIADLLFLPPLLIALDGGRIRRAIPAAIGATAVLFMASTSFAAPSGREIAEEADRRDRGWADSAAELVMTLENRSGDKSVRNLEIRNLEIEDDGDKSLVFFHSPRDVRGTAFLTFTHDVTPDDQWLFLPALKRVKRISSANKSGPFMGSEFAYEDIASQELGKYTYRFVREEELDGKKTFVVERVPTYESSGYTRQVVWYDQAEYRVLRTDFYDRKNALLKTLVYSGYEKYLGQYWRPSRMHMSNHQSGKSTVLDWKNYRFRNGFGERDFSKNRLKRGR